MDKNLMEKVVSLCKRRGFIFQSSDIYGGQANTWDYGPYGVELKNNLKRAWWKANVYERNDVYGIDAAILMHPKTWEASGHVENFYDLKSDCRQCRKRFKTADLEGAVGDSARKAGAVPAARKCPECGGELTESRPFNLMFKTHQGPVEEAANLVYLRPETAQGMFVNFLNIMDSRHPKLPFGMAQIGKAFRNEITPGNFTFRTCEFEQMEIEYFVRPEAAVDALNDWIASRYQWYLNLGMKADNLRKRPHEKDELAHYALACTDIEYNFSFGWSELEGIANRTDFDLRRHSEASGKELKFFDEATKEKFYPYIIEPSGGVDRSVLAFLNDAYNEEKVKEDIRVVLKLHKDLAPTKVAVLPLLRNRPEIVEMAKRLAADLKKSFITVYDDTGAIGKLYRRQDEVGTLYCLTVDVQSLEDKQVTVRDRDTMLQERISLDKVKE
ncbi:MAG: glycine--tRNA ligase, partial [Candidatus Omnitrophota bacterium]|nr:glycine--tRNA ligase [Candidatus Omnitrophota bacterium]